jgi:hypothetical protein
MAVTRCEPNRALLLPRLRVAHKTYARKIATWELNIAQSTDVTAEIRVIAMFPVVKTLQSL